MSVSVALCTFNGEKYVASQLHSILSQTCAVNEIIICDDLSTDNTISILKAYKKKYPELFHLHLATKNIGAIHNFEKAISLCTGDIIFLSDQDDIWNENKVETIMKLFNENEQALEIFSDANLMDENDTLLEGSLWEKWGFDENMQQDWMNNANAHADLLKNNNKITGATVAFRKSLKELFLPFNAPEGYWHDTWISLFAAKNNGLFFTRDKLVQYRIHPGQLIGIGNGIALKKRKKKIFTRKRIAHSLEYMFKSK